ncbi:hypothetical protein KNE206_30380 [Kitasatospora sp. NE20-6]|uniref:hypothetical protein n=1 Tax=Kitasatospora sp. NE20-6 TaxID=2859066 RepID=UPI0034DB8B84
MTTPRTLPVNRPNGGFRVPTADPTSVRFHMVDGDEILTYDVSGSFPTFQMCGGTTATKTLSLDWWLRFLDPKHADHPTNRVQAAVVAREAAVQSGGSPDLAQFGRIALGLKRSERWTEALSTALLGDWITPLHDGTSLGLFALDHLRSETRTIHTQMVPLWERRIYGNRRVLMLEKPSAGGGTLRDLLADRHLPEDPLLDQVPGDRRLAALLQRLAPAERAVVLAYGQPSVATWPEAAELVGADQPQAFAERVRTKVRRIVKMLQQQDQQRIDGPTGLWTPTRNGGAQ